MTEREPNVGIIGTHVSQSLSPIMHNAAYQEMDVDFRYGTFELEEVEPEARVERLAQELDQLLDQGVVGLSVTMPFKTDLLETGRMYASSHAVKTIGAANTLSMPRDGKWSADNTDWMGAVQSLQEAGVTIQDKTALVIGAGGTARAVAYGLAEWGARTVTIANRTPERARSLSQELQSTTKQTKFCWTTTDGLEELTLHDKATLRELDIVYNTTSVGQEGTLSAGDLPLSPAALRVLSRGVAVDDALYMPIETPLLREARELGLTTINGTRMLLHQAVRQVRIITGENDVPVGVMDEALQAEIARRRRL